MRKVLATLSLVVLTACVTTGWSPKPCPTIVVDNDNFADVNVYAEWNGRMLGMVTGKRVRTLKACGLVGHRPGLYLKAIGGAFTLSLGRDVQYIDQPTDTLLLYIGATPNFSYLVPGE